VRGYSATVTETCEEEELNLIVDVQVEPATTADNSYLKEAVQNSEEVFEGTAREISADGAYYSEENETYAKGQEKDKKKLKYRGKFRAQLWAVCRAAWINMRRIASYQAKQTEAVA
jgi:hypothetical protein